MSCLNLRAPIKILAPLPMHLDELFDANKRLYYDLLETTTTVFIFLSPQFLINHPEARDVFIECSHCTTLCVIALDEAHIHMQHGTLFRSEIRALQVLFFAKIFHEQLPMMPPRLIVLTATMPTSYLPHLCRLLTVSSFHGKSIIRASPTDFDQHEIEMQTYICSAKGLYVSKGLTLVSEFLRDHPMKSAVIFCNSQHQSQHFRDHLERKLTSRNLTSTSSISTVRCTKLISSGVFVCSVMKVTSARPIFKCWKQRMLQMLASINHRLPCSVLCRLLA